MLSWLKNKKKEILRESWLAWLTWKLKLMRCSFNSMKLQGCMVKSNALVVDGILVADDQGNLDLNADDEQFEQVITNKINQSKQKRQLAAS